MSRYWTVIGGSSGQLIQTEPGDMQTHVKKI